jgi:hypothetical protein
LRCATGRAAARELLFHRARTPPPLEKFDPHTKNRAR